MEESSAIEKATNSIENYYIKSSDVEQALYEIDTAIQYLNFAVSAPTTKAEIYKAFEKVDGAYKRLRVTIDNIDSYLNHVGKSLDPLLKILGETEVKQ